jgi:AcrR family transcriptional regulator
LALRKGDATRVRILDEATRQVAVRGLTAASLGDLAGAVGLSKSGLFKHFESKEAMQLAIIERVQEQFSDFVWSPLQDVSPGRARLEAVFDRWLDWSENQWRDHGCPIMALSVELDDQPGPLRDALQKGMARWRRTLMREFAGMRAPPLSEAEAAAAYFQMKSYLLGHAEARRLMGDPDARRSARAAFHALLDRCERPAA